MRVDGKDLVPLLHVCAHRFIAVFATIATGAEDGDGGFGYSKIPLSKRRVGAVHGPFLRLLMQVAPGCAAVVGHYGRRLAGKICAAPTDYPITVRESRDYSASDVSILAIIS